MLVFFITLLTSLSLYAADFIKVRGTHFELNGAKYSFLGTNFWYGMNLAAEGPSGDRPRLIRELDRLEKLGVKNLRIMAASEGPDSEPWRIVPAAQTNPGHYNPALMRGFDFLLSEMKKRKMHVVVCLGNFWPWSGGMSQYLNWMGAGPIPYPPPEHNGSWSVFQTYTEKFYSNDFAMNAAADFIKTIVPSHADDPTIMAWQLANEPRGGSNTAAFNRWIEKTADLIKSLDKNHLVTTGAEGDTPWPKSNGMDFATNHRYKNIDYATIHIWAQNWFWYDPALAENSFDTAVSEMKKYLHSHLERAKKIGKPLVLEEFGLARDEGSYDPTASTKYRDEYYAAVFEEIYQASKAGEPAAGVNFWAWAGEAQPVKPFGGYWKPGMPFIGDPPHEAQGWYSVYATDKSTLGVIEKYSKLLR